MVRKRKAKLMRFEALPKWDEKRTDDNCGFVISMIVASLIGLGLILIYGREVITK